MKEDGKKVKGLLKTVSDGDVEIEYEVKEKIGKKNIKRTILQPIAEEEIEKIIVKVSF